MRCPKRIEIKQKRNIINCGLFFFNRLPARFTRQKLTSIPDIGVISNLPQNSEERRESLSSKVTYFSITQKGMMAPQHRETSF